MLGLTMMSAQAFAYNAVFFTYGLVLTTFMHANGAHIGLYIVPFALGNFAGPLLLGPLFDKVGRRVMLDVDAHAAGRRAHRHGDPVPAAGAERRLADGALVRRLLLRFRCRERCVPDGQRGVPARDPRDGDRVLLCGRHGHRRDPRPGALRKADRLEELHRGDDRLPDRRRVAARGRARSPGSSRSTPRASPSRTSPSRSRRSRTTTRSRTRTRRTSRRSASAARSRLLRRVPAHTGRRATRSTVADDSLEGQVAAIGASPPSPTVRFPSASCSRARTPVTGARASRAGRCAVRCAKAASSANGAGYTAR